MLGANARLYSLSAPLIYLSYPVPKIVILPIILLFLGLGDASKVTMIALILFFQILILVRDEVRTVRPELVFSVRSLGANRLQLLWHVFLPASLPGLFHALRVSTGVSIAVLFFVRVSEPSRDWATTFWWNHGPSGIRGDVCGRHYNGSARSGNLLRSRWP